MTKIVLNIPWSMFHRKYQGKSFAAIGKELNRSKSCIKNIIDRYNETNSYKDRPRAGRPRISTANENPKINKTLVQALVSGLFDFASLEYTHGQKEFIKEISSKEINFDNNQINKNSKLEQDKLKKKLEECGQQKDKINLLNNRNNETIMSNATKKPARSTQFLTEFFAKDKKQVQVLIQKKLLTSIEKCDEIQIKLENLEQEINSFNGRKGDYCYSKINGSLDIILEELDNCERGDETVNYYRKSLINFTNKLGEKLESKCKKIQYF
ncbi:unnamed protein product [Brachionus calyciflorus]|uniref:Uncharacterized protein n=1 Tax=Brachionus calyciflorus TaxID=104777 RepID=A0A813REE3_9BILA|nr:unnamed protein product [Brachionus calyciflorus]